MNEKTKVAIVGYGNIGRYAVDAVNQAPDLELAGIVRRSSSLVNPKDPVLNTIPVVSSIFELKDVKVALLCIPSRTVEDYAKEVLALGINTVDSYDIHGELAVLRNELNEVARKYNSVAIISAGWDPGTDSILRCMFEFMAPFGLTYTNFGPGMSMGHTVAVKSIPGVKNALSMTIPLGAGIHRRIVYVEVKDEFSFADIEKRIKTDPYFAYDETHVIQVNDVERLVDMGHGVSMERKGVSGLSHNQLLRFEMKVNNPALTAQVMVAAARASLKQQAGGLHYD
jgi:diaminopimelate dehydrogenase